MKKSLTKMQARFVAEYVAAPNAARAAVRAGFSAHSANGIGYKLLQKPHVKAAIADGTARVFAKLEIDAETLLREVARVILVDLTRLIGDDGRPKDLGDIDAETMAALELTITFDKEGQLNGSRLRRLDKIAALTLAFKYLNLFAGRVEARERAP